MISVNKYFGGLYNVDLELYGLSTDTKPTDSFKDIEIFNGALFYEMDTGKISIFDEENHKWWEV